jgi:hypothetical protein
MLAAVTGRDLSLLWLLQKEDLARMYRLFQRIPKGLDPIAEMFKKHVEGEGMKLVKEVSDALQSKKDKEPGGRLGHYAGELQRPGVLLLPIVD